MKAMRIKLDLAKTHFANWIQLEGLDIPSGEYTMILMFVFCSDWKAAACIEGIVKDSQ